MWTAWVKLGKMIPTIYLFKEAKIAKRETWKDFFNETGLGRNGEGKWREIQEKNRVFLFLKQDVAY